jgi:hypothetical protein
MATRVTIEVSDARLAEVLCSAYEGGSTYWAKQKDGKASPFRFSEVSRGGRVLGPLELVPDFSVTITDSEADPPAEHVLTPTKLRAGLQVMAEKYPKHFADVMTEDGDATTGDVLLQCALFGKLVYG